MNLLPFEDNKRILAPRFTDRLRLHLIPLSARPQLECRPNTSQQRSAEPFDPCLPPINRLEMGSEMNSGMPVKHGIYGLAKQMFAD